MLNHVTTVGPLVLAADVATAGTFTVTYPAGYAKSDFATSGHKISALNLADFSYAKDFTIAFGVSSATVTWRNAATLLAGTTLWVELRKKGTRDWVDPSSTRNPTRAIKGNRTSQLALLEVNLGAPIASAATGVTTAQLLGAAGPLVIDGASATGGVATADVPRNVTLTVATTNQSGVNFTVTGTDEFGAVLKETITGPNANTVQGKKAFKTVTGVTASAAVATNGVSVGFGQLLGIPVVLTNSVFVIKEMQDGAAPTTGTFAAADLANPTATTGDVRGTYSPNAAPDGSKAFSLLIAVENALEIGPTNFSG